MRRICCFCERWESGGIESFLRNVLLHMDLSDLEVDIVAASIGPSIFTAELESLGVRFIELSGKLRSPKNCRLFCKLLREKHYDVIHFNLYQGLALYYVRIAQREGIPIRIAHSHNTALRKSVGHSIKLMFHALGSMIFADSATELWACSQQAAKFLFPDKTLKKKNYRFIPNGIETARFCFDPAIRETVRAKLGLTDSFVVGHIGRLCYQKNQEFLLNAFAQLLKRRSESRLLLIGEGELEGQLKEQAVSLGIADKVIFYGVMNHVESLLWAMDLFAFPSLFEGLGIVAVEAQAAGLPTVCSERIPPEAKVSDLCTLHPLAAGAPSWGEFLGSVRTCGDRSAMAQTVAQAGFDIAQVSGMIERCYQGAAE